MPNYLYNGVELPALPEWDKTTYPYAWIVRQDADGEEYDFCHLYVTTATCYVGPNNVVRASADIERIMYDLVYGVWVAGEPTTVSANGAVSYVGKLMVWSNYDVYTTDGTLYLAASDPIPVSNPPAPYPFWLTMGWLVGRAIAKNLRTTGGIVNTAGIYGVEWNYTNSGTKLTRTDDAAYFDAPVPATALTEAGSSPFDGIMPWAGMKRYNVVNNEVAYSEESADFSMTDYDTVVYIPEFYYKVEEDTANGTIKWSISASRSDGFSRHPGSGRYVGRYHTANANGVYCSYSGRTPVNSVTRATVRTNSHAKGDNWWMIDLATWSALQLLYLVEFADWNSQAVLGGGQNSGSVKSNGGTDAAVYHTLNRSGASNQYRWIEDPWSNVFDWVDGFIASGRACYVGTDNSSFGDTVTGLTASGVTLPSNGYITKLSISELAPWAFLPNKSSGANGTYIPDYVYSGSGVGVLYVGGGYGAGAGRGLFLFSAYVSASGAYADIGSRLLYIP